MVHLHFVSLSHLPCIFEYVPIYSIFLCLQNNILLNRLGAVNVQIAEERTLSALSAEGSASETKAEGDLQTVINYLRRSKEIVRIIVLSFNMPNTCVTIFLALQSETEISLLKQERLRLQAQVSICFISLFQCINYLFLILDVILGVVHLKWF